MKYLAVLGRQPEISLAELAALFENVEQKNRLIATFEAEKDPDINRLGGVLKLAKSLENISPDEYLSKLPEGKITLGISDYTPEHYSSRDIKNTINLGLKLKKTLKNSNRSLRLLPNTTPVISTAAAHHNGLGRHPKKVELIKYQDAWFVSIGCQNITAYKNRDQVRPARDAKVGMLPPKLAQILINLCGPLPEGSTILDPFCGTGVVLQEALLMGYRAYGTDKDERMVRYSERNMAWLAGKGTRVSEGNTERGSARTSAARPGRPPLGTRKVEGLRAEPTRPKETLVPFLHLEVGDAEKHQWQTPITAIAAETYLGPPMSEPPAEMKLKLAKADCGAILTGFLKNLAPQIDQNTPVTLAIPAWRRQDGRFEHLKTIDEIEKLGYNVLNKSAGDLLYVRENQVVAREIIVLRKK